MGTVVSLRKKKKLFLEVFLRGELDNHIQWNLFTKFHIHSSLIGSNQYVITVSKCHI